jgi:uncharacterized protein YndB with AHSA1/START domain
MTAGRRAQATVSVTVAVPPAVAFEVFTAEIDRWWRRGPKYRHAKGASGLLRIEPGVGGRVFESFGPEEKPTVVDVGRVTTWEPPRRLAFDWRNATFAVDEWTRVEVAFEDLGERTLVTVRHSGWEKLRPDHPARHGLADVAFARELALFWGDLMTSLREHAAEK